VKGVRSGHAIIDAHVNAAPSSGALDARGVLVAQTIASIELCRQHADELRHAIQACREAGFADGIRVGRRFLKAVLESLRRHEKRLAALQAGISDEDLARWLDADLKAIAARWDRADRSFDRARARGSRATQLPPQYRAVARHARPTYRRRSPRRAARVAAPSAAGDGSPPPGPESAGAATPSDVRLRAGGAR
jgi:hypothetical protein